MSDNAGGPDVSNTRLLAALVHFTDALQDCCECHIYERKPTQAQWDQYDAALKEGKELKANIPICVKQKETHATEPTTR